MTNQAGEKSAPKTVLCPVVGSLDQEHKDLPFDDATNGKVELVLARQMSLIGLDKLYRNNRLQQRMLHCAMSLLSWTILSSLYLAMCSIAVAECTVRVCAFGIHDKAL